jgi:hypothetical protein
MDDVFDYMRITGSGDSDALLGRGCYPFTREGGECLKPAQPLCCNRVYPVRTF